MLRRHHPHHPAAADDTRRHRWATRLGRLTGSVVALVVLAPAVATAMPIEGYSSYEPQKICSPNAKPAAIVENAMAASRPSASTLRRKGNAGSMEIRTRPLACGGGGPH